MLRSSFVTPSLLRSGGLLLSLLPVVAAAWNRPLEVASLYGAPIVRADSNAAGQYWAVGDDARISFLTRFDTGTEPNAAVDAGADSIVGATHVTERGELVAIVYRRSLPSECRVVKYDADGTKRWTRPFSACRYALPPETRIWPSHDGTLQVRMDTRLIRLGGDGRLLGQLDASALAGPVDAVDPRDGTSYVATADSAAPTVVAYDRSGVERWRTPVQAPVRIAVAADGSLRVIGIQQGNLFLAAIGTDGRQRWSTVVDPNAQPIDYANLRPPLVDAAGTSVATQGGAVAAARVGADGSVAWRVNRSEIGATHAESGARLAPNGDVVLAHRSRVSRISADGRVLYSKNVEAPGFSALNSIAAFNRHGETIVLQLEVGHLRGYLVRLAADGSELSRPSIGGTAGVLTKAQRTALPYGSIAAWTAGGSKELMAVDAGGNLLWRRPTPGTWSVLSTTEDYGAVTAAVGRVCTLDGLHRDNTRDHVLACFRADDGQPLWSQRVLRENTGRGWSSIARLHIATDRSMAAWYGYGDYPPNAATDKVGYSRVDGDGNVVASLTFDAARLLAAAPSDAPFALVAKDGEILVFDANGGERYRFTPSYAANGTIGSAGFGVDGSLVVLAASSTTSGGIAVRYDAAGRETWRRPFDTTTREFKAPLVTNDAVYVATCCTNDNTQHRVARYAAADGAVAWQRDVPLSPASRPGSAALASNDDGSEIVAVRSSGRTLDVDVIAARGGDLRSQRREACRSDNCSSGTPLVSYDVLHLLDIGATAGSSLIGWKIPPASARNARLDQPGIVGAWWAPYANGEGFVLDYLPASRTLFMPWFTFSREGGNDPAGQRWYVVQGSVAANATSAELPITLATGGAFDAGPPVPATIVGSATLTFTDCDNGTLQYRFDAAHNGGATGTITLSRLLSASEDCLLPDGTTQVRESPPVNGFDARMSGSWYEEATAGQGLQFAVQPDGIFFAPWFTYDPANTSNDPGRQHWYTIQGSLAQARNGVATLPIVQAIGGAFDSVPTNNMYIVGQATITMLACDRAKLDYRFDDNELAGPVRTRSGSIDLVKAGGCMP